jgi:hypothetical protein
VNLPAVWDALRGLLPGGVPVHDAEVLDPRPALPWLVLDVLPPAGWARAQSGSRHAGVVEALVTVAAASPGGRALWTGRVIDALDRAWVRPDGWGGAQIRQAGEVEQFRDPEVRVPGTGADCFVAKLHFELTICEEPA